MAAYLNTSASCINLTQTPIKAGISVPAGHIIVSQRWKGTQLIIALQGKVNIIYEEGLGVADFHPSSNIGVVYVSEADQVMGNMYRRKLAKLRKANSVRGIVIVEKTATSTQYFPGLQKFVVLELGLVLIPVFSQSEAGNFLVQLVHLESKPQGNPFLKSLKRPPPDSAVLATVQSIPRLGEVKAKALLNQFKSIKGICNAPEKEISKVIGSSLALHVRSFLQRTDRG